eukprot:scaffold133292_cov94-Phaeocystis_antarctica.AAC.1
MKLRRPCGRAPQPAAVSHVRLDAPVRCVLKGELHDALPSTSSSRHVMLLEQLAPCGEREASEGGVVIELVRDQLLDIVWLPLRSQFTV